MALNRLRENGVLLSKVHLSSALKLSPTPAACAALAAFADATYLHQVVARSADGRLQRFRDLPEALAQTSFPDARPSAGAAQPSLEWRVHFHIPLHSAPTPVFGTTTDHLLGVLDYVAVHPDACSHFEMETYTWEVLPPELKAPGVVDQLAQEYDWMLAELAKRGLASR